MSTLYELSAGYAQLMEMAEDPDVDPEVFADTLEGLGGEIEDKADSYAKVIRSMEGDAASIKSEIDRLVRKKTTIENNISRMKQNLETVMIQTGKTKFKTQLFSFNIQKNPPSAYILDEKAVPAEFMVQHEPTVNKKAIIAYLKDFGDQDWAQLQQSESLRIR